MWHFPVCHFPGYCILLFRMPCQWVWMMAVETKLRRYIRAHNTGKLLQMKEHVLPLNIQMSTNIWNMLIWVLTAFWLDKRAWRVSCFRYRTIQEAESFPQDIWFNTFSQHQRNAVNHVCKWHVNRKICSYQRCSIFTGGGGGGGGSHNQILVWWQVKLQHLKSTLDWNQWMGDGR